MDRNYRRKALFINNPNGQNLTVEEVINIAKNQAHRIGLRNKESIKTLRCDANPELNGWCVVLEEQ